MSKQIRSVVGDSIYTFGDGDVYVNALDPKDIKKSSEICRNKGGLKKWGYHAADGKVYDVAEALEAYPEILEPG